ncbi:MAG: oxidoreductase [Burkholderiales bacterium]|nr:oxidoreductase [Burkholderiales bacterium]
MTELKLRVVDARRLNPLIRELQLADPDGRPLPPFEAGAHIQVQVRLGEGSHDWRHYSLVELSGAAAAHGAPDRYVIAVRLEDMGRGGSRYMHEGLKVGDLVAVRPPKNEFPLQPGAGRVVLLAGGIGVTPIATMAAQCRALGRPLTLVYAGRSRALMAYLEPLKALLGDALRVHADDEQGGRPLDVDAVLGDCGGGDETVHVCGPRALLDQVLARAAARGWAPARVRFEIFATPQSEAGDRPFELVLAQSGTTLQVPVGKTIIDSLRALGEDPLCDCLRGECGVCAVAVIEGEVDHRDYVLSAAEKQSNKVMQICVSRARGARLVIDL